MSEHPQHHATTLLEIGDRLEAVEKALAQKADKAEVESLRNEVRNAATATGLAEGRILDAQARIESKLSRLIDFWGIPLEGDDVGGG